MKLLKPVKLLSAVTILISGYTSEAQNQTAKPNIIILLADDMGYSDPGCYGGEIATPALDRLEKEGIRLTHFRNSAMCVCSRASLLTGNYWTKAIPEYTKTQLLPEKLKEAGYRTALIGKWQKRRALCTSRRPWFRNSVYTKRNA